MPSIAVIGAGNVGPSVAYACLLTKTASKIIMVEIDSPRCEAQVLDIADTAFIHDCKIKVGTFQEAGQSDIVIITAGAKQNIGEPRTELIARNDKILKSCIESMKPFKKETILILVSNPVDILTSLAQKHSGLPPNQVLGTGTFLDTARLRSTLSDQLNVAETAVHIYVLGEHGDSQFVAWSSAHIATCPLEKYPGVDKLDLEGMTKDCGYFLRVNTFGCSINDKLDSASALFGLVTYLTRYCMENPLGWKVVSKTYLSTKNAARSCPICQREGR
jgi:L-lactate dehydrogenase